MNHIYLDYAASTPLDDRVFEAMRPYFSDKFYNPSSIYLSSKVVKSDIESARSNVAKIVGAKPGEIIFTAGGTEANNLAVNGIMQRHPKANSVVSSIEHDSILKPATKYAHKIIKVNEKADIDLQDLVNKIDDNTVLVSVMLANNEVGTIQPIREIAQIVKKVRKRRLAKGNELPIYLHTDACQAGNYLDIHTSRLGVDLMTLNGGKIYGPKQSGVLFVRANILLEPQILGGGQENSLRSGTENVPGIIGFAKALEITQRRKSSEVKRLSELQKTFISMLEDKIPQAVINGSLNSRLPNNLHTTIPGQDNERLIMMLDEMGVECAAGSACSASNDEPSHVLKAMKLSDEYAQSSLRFTMGRSTTKEDIETCIKVLAECIK